MAVLRGMVEDCKAAKRWQKSIKPVVDVLVTFSRDDGTRLDKRQQDSYFRNALDFLNARYGAENVLCAAIHRDETTSHLQVLIAARHEGGRLSSSKLMGNRTALSALQDDFHEAVAKPFGLLRGEKRTNAKHVPVRALYAAMNAGAEPPDFRPVPPELTMGERLRLNGYQKEEREKQRQQAIDHNNAQRELLTRQAADGRKLHPSLIAKQATRYRAAVQQAENAAQAATRAENGPQRPGKGPRQGKGRPRLWTSSWTPKRPSLSAWIERSSSAGATAGTGRVLARADGHHCAVTFETGLQAASVLGLAARHYSVVTHSGHFKKRDHAFFALVDDLERIEEIGA